MTAAVPSAFVWTGATDGTPGSAAIAASSGRERRVDGGPSSVDRQQQRTVEAGTEAVGEQVVGLRGW